VVKNIRYQWGSQMTVSPAVTINTEDYLEAILRLITEKGAARVRDIAAALAVHKSTVSQNLKTLAEKGLVKYSRYETTTLTASGQKIAEDISRRHQVIGQFLEEILGVDEAAAQANACRMEHILDAEVLERLSLFVAFANAHVAQGDRWLQQFQRYSKTKVQSATKKSRAVIAE
jgi:DtxR family transcriptional regulator, Mn-dependent transcriptional regulator